MDFYRLADRWEHRIVVVSGESETIVLTSIEGDAATVYPPSPPLQDLDRHELASGDAVLAVGMAGTNHWSASFSVEAGTILYADLACLFKHSAPDDSSMLKSSYQIVGDIAVEKSESGLFVPVGFCKVVIEPSQDDPMASQADLNQDRTVIFPQQVNADPAKATRWGYRIFVQESS